MILNANPYLENKFFSKKVKKKISKVINSGRYILGKEVKNFEKKFSNFIGSKYALGVNSGTDALIIALKTLGVSKGDEVIVPSISASATAIAVKNVGAKIVYADLDLESYNVSARTIKPKISKKTKVIIVVHLHGLSADITAIKKIIRNKNIKIIEDCAQSHGSKLNNKYTGNLGDIGCFSFYPTKNLNCIGDGGAITTSNKRFYNLAKQIREYGWVNRDDSKIVGINSRLDEIQAAILTIKLKKLSFLNNQRRKIAKKYYTNITKSKKIILPKFKKNDNHVFHHFVVRLENINRSKLIRSFLKKGIQILIHYKKPLFEQNALKGSSIKFSNASKIANNTISLPIYPNLKNQDIKRVYRELNKYA